jgi:hypothetical protein
MSLLMFTLVPEGVWVVTDTLAMTMEGDLHLLVSKCVAVPHLELVLAFTGVANLGQEWSQMVHSRVLAADIDMLDRHTPAALRGMYEDIDCQESATATIYHLGFSTDQGAYVGYVYRSTNDFCSEGMEPGFRVKPDPPAGFQPPESVDEIIRLAKEIRANQDRLPAAERVYIGGELVLTSLQENTICSRKIHRFADFDEAWLTMNENLNQ